MTRHYIICHNCKTGNQNSDYCYNCGEIINIILKRKLAQEKYRKDKEEEKKSKALTKTQIIIEKLKNHPNKLVRGVFYFFHSIGTVVFLIAAVIALIVGALLI